MNTQTDLNTIDIRNVSSTIRTMSTESLADYVRYSDEWISNYNIECVEELAERAGLSEAWRNADGDNFEDVIRMIENRLDIIL